MPTDLLVVGAGGHAKVVAEAIQACTPAHRIFLVDQDKSRAGMLLLVIFR